MSMTSNSTPSRSSAPLSRLQWPHQGVLYIVSMVWATPPCPQLFRQDGPVSSDGTVSADVLAGLDPEQRQAAEALRGPVCILAGAGTGKTRAITHRTANLVLSGVATADRVLAVTFTTRAAGEMRSRLRALGVGGVQARTFHSAALRQLQYFWPRISPGGRRTIIESKLPSIRAAAARLRVPVDPAAQRDLASEIEWAKAALVTPESYAAAARAADREPPFDLATVQRVFAAYEDVNGERGQLDFEDL